MTRRKAAVAGAMGDTLTVARGGTYIADREMAARLARGDRPIYDDIRAASVRVEEGDVLRVADLHQWVLAALIANGMVVMDPDAAPWSTLGDDVGTDTDPDDGGQQDEPEAPPTDDDWPADDEEGD